jgi:hypothetical protein
MGRAYWRELTVPELNSCPAACRAVCEARRVHESIHVTRALEGCVYEAIVVIRGDVSLHKQTIRADGAEFLSRRFAFSASTANDQARFPLSREPFGDGQPEALRAAGDDRDGGPVLQKNSHHSCQLTSQLDSDGSAEHRSAWWLMEFR